jgi:hypothetical protein
MINCYKLLIDRISQGDTRGSWARMETILYCCTGRFTMDLDRGVMFYGCVFWMLSTRTEPLVFRLFKVVGRPRGF